MIRLFAALELPDEIAAVLQRRQQGLPRARWHDRDKLHITLAFYGEVSNEAAAEIDAGLSAIRLAPFDVELAGVGVQNEGHEVRAVRALVEPNPALEELAARCEAVGRRAGVAPEKRTYRPHATLAYLRHADPDRVAAWVANHNLLHSPPFEAGWFGLYSSWLSKDGSRYELEREYSLIPPAAP